MSATDWSKKINGFWERWGNTDYTAAIPKYISCLVPVPCSIFRNPRGQTGSQCLWKGCRAHISYRTSLTQHHDTYRGVNALILLAEQQLGLWQSSQISGNKGIKIILHRLYYRRVKDVSSEQKVSSHSVNGLRIQVHFSTWILQEFLSPFLVRILTLEGISVALMWSHRKLGRNSLDYFDWLQGEK